MTEKNLLEDDIIDLTDLLEEGSPPEKTVQEPPKRKGVPEPESFDLGKEISMDFDVSVEEIEHEGTVKADEPPLVPEERSLEPYVAGQETREPLGDIGAEIDLAMQDRLEDVTLTKNEEEALLREGPAEELAPTPEEVTVLSGPEPLGVPEAPYEDSAAVPEAPPAPAARPEPAPQVAGYAPVPAEVVVDAVVSEFRKDMPTILGDIVRPIVQELLQEIIASTREALPGIVEKVIREEIERLKKL